MDKSRRVVVTGIGNVTSLGANVAQSFNNLCNGVSGIRFMTKEDGPDWEDFPYPTAAPVHPDFNKELILERYPHVNTPGAYAISALEEALEDSNFKPETEKERNRTGVVCSMVHGPYLEGEAMMRKYHDSGKTKIDPNYYYIEHNVFMLHTAAQIVGASGYMASPSHACSNGGQNVGKAYRAIKRGYADAVVAVSADNTMTPFWNYEWVITGLSPKEVSDPKTIMRPFDMDRQGTIISEGAGCLVLEEYEQAKARGAKIYCEILGFGDTGDASSIIAPHPTADGLWMSLITAFKQAQIEPEVIDVINPHAPSTPSGDLGDYMAIEKIFTKSEPKISASKSYTGHALGAAGIMEAIFSINMLDQQKIPGTANTKNILEYKGRRPNLVLETHNAKIDTVLNLNSGAGGTNAALIFQKCD